MTARWRRDDAWKVLARRQAGLITTRQLRDWGWTWDDIRRPVDSGRWQRVGNGVLGTGPTVSTPTAQVWRVVLASEGLACGPTALWLAGMEGVTPGPPVVAVDWQRRAPRVEGAKVHRHRELRRLRAPGTAPPRVRAEVALLEVCSGLADPEAVVGLVLSAVQQRRCTVERIRGDLGTGGRRWRGLLLEVLGEAEAGSRSTLELRYARHVERAHGLPLGARNCDLGLAGGVQIVDVLYELWGVVVELDGRLAHPSHLAFRDQARDNRAVVAGLLPLRFGWRDVVGWPCEVARQVAGVLRARGWDGVPRQCGPGCRAAG